MDILLIVLLTLLNGVFALSELALASSRKARLVAAAEAGDKSSRAALSLLENPTQFLSSVQVGITSIGMLNGIIGEAAFSTHIGLDGQAKVKFWHGLLNSGMLASESVELAPFVAESVVASVRFERTACMCMVGRTR